MYYLISRILLGFPSFNTGKRFSYFTELEIEGIRRFAKLAQNAHSAMSRPSRIKVESVFLSRKAVLHTFCHLQILFPVK